MKRCCLYFALMLLIAACDTGKKKTYSELVKQGLGKGVREDSLFLGIYLGMSSKDFYGHCWELNKKGVIRGRAGFMPSEDEGISRCF